MATFNYSAYAADGQLASGTLEAADRAEAVRQLSARRLQPVSVSPALSAASGKVSTVTRRHVVEAELERDAQPVRLKSAQVTLFVEELAELLGGGIQLEPALGIMERRKELSGLKTVARLIRARLRDGQSFAAAVQASSPSFGEMFANLAAAGEMSGSLGAVLKRQAAYLKSLEELKSRVLFALIYPAFLIFSAVAVAALFVIFLIPKLMDLLDSTGGSLPAGAQFILGLSTFFKSTWWMFLILGTVTFLALRGWAGKEENRPAWDRFILRLPFLGGLSRHRFYVQFLETLCNLVSNGLPLNRALELTRAATPNRYLRLRLGEVISQVADGGSLSASLERTGEFSTLLVDMVTVGEQTGQLPASLARAALRFDSELRKRTEKLSAIIQPAVVVLMAGMVGAMAYLMITAIFQTISGMHG